MEDTRQLAVYSYATSKITKSEARTMTVKVLRLPGSVKHLEKEPSDKALSLGREEIERIFQARYEQSILRNTVGRQQRYTSVRATFHKSFFERNKGQLHTKAQSSNQSQ
jgi:hypothetical protein